MAAEEPTDAEKGNLYKYETIRMAWTKFLERNHYRHASTAKEYFSNFIRSHRGFQFSVTQIFDGTTHDMVEKDQYLMIKEEVENKTSKTMPDVYIFDMSGPVNKVLKKTVFTTQQQFKTHSLDLKMENDRIQQRKRTDAAQHVQELRNAFSSAKKPKILVLDLEVHDKDRKTILEIGYVTFKLKDDSEPEYFHAIVTENLHLVNKNVPDNREHFRFGTSVRMTLKEAAEHFQEDIAGADFLVTHAGANDERYMAENGINIKGKKGFDTQVLALNLLPRGPPCWGLKKMMEEMGIEFEETDLHNAGNDAHYTMKSFRALVRRAGVSGLA